MPRTTDRQSQPDPPGRARGPRGATSEARPPAGGWPRAGCWGSRPGCCSRPPSPARRAPGDAAHGRGAVRRPGHPGRAARRRRRRGAARGRPARRPRRGAPLLGGRRGRQPGAADPAAGHRPLPHLQHRQDLHRHRRPAAGRRGRALPGRHRPRWLDDPAVARIPNTDAITLRQLLTHTSGIYDYQDETDSPFYLDAFFGPGADWAPGVDAPGTARLRRRRPARARTSRRGRGWPTPTPTTSCSAWSSRRRPAGPSGTSCATASWAPWPSTTPPWRRARPWPADVVDGYQRSEGQLVNVSAVNLTWAWAAGGVVSTAADLARFARAVFGGELLSPASHEAMFTFVPGAWGPPRVRHGRVPGPDAQRRAGRDGRRRGRGHLDHDAAPRGGRDRGGAGQRRRRRRGSTASATRRSPGPWPSRLAGGGSPPALPETGTLEDPGKAPVMDEDLYFAIAVEVGAARAEAEAVVVVPAGAGACGPRACRRSRRRRRRRDGAPRAAAGRSRIRIFTSAATIQAWSGSVGRGRGEGVSGRLLGRHHHDGARTTRRDSQHARRGRAGSLLAQEQARAATAAPFGHQRNVAAWIVSVSTGRSPATAPA